MTDDRLLERTARSWLEEGPARAPDRAVGAALSRIQTTAQERDLRISWRLPSMSPVARLAAVAIVAIASVGSSFLILTRVTDGPGAVPPQPGTIAQLSGPWRPVPYVVPADVLAAADAACRNDPDMPKDARLVISDARGATTPPGDSIVGTLGFLLPNGDFAHCSVVRFDRALAQAYIDLKGCVMLAQPSGARCVGQVPAAPLQIAVLVQGPRDFAGKVGEGITSVRLVYANGLSATASVDGDWFAVYGPNDALGQSFRLLAVNASGDVVATFAPAQ